MGSLKRQLTVRWEQVELFVIQIRALLFAVAHYSRFLHREYKTMVLAEFNLMKYI